MSARFTGKVELELYDAADEYARLKSNGGFTSSDDIDAGRRRLRRAARVFASRGDSEQHREDCDLETNAARQVNLP